MTTKIAIAAWSFLASVALAAIGEPVEWAKSVLETAKAAEVEQLNVELSYRLLIDNSQTVLVTGNCEILRCPTHGILIWSTLTSPNPNKQAEANYSHSLLPGAIDVPSPDKYEREANPGLLIPVDRMLAELSMKTGAVSHYVLPLYPEVLGAESFTTLETQDIAESWYRNGRLWEVRLTESAAQRLIGERMRLSNPAIELDSITDSALYVRFDDAGERVAEIREQFLMGSGHRQIVSQITVEQTDHSRCDQ